MQLSMKLSKVDITTIVIVLAFIAFLVKFLHPRSVSFIQMYYFKERMTFFIFK